MSQNKIKDTMVEFETKVETSIDRMNNISDHLTTMSGEDQEFYKTELDSIKDAFRDLVQESQELQTARIQAVQKYQSEMKESLELLNSLQNRDAFQKN